MKRILCGFLAGAVLSGAALAQSGPYQQSPAVLARYPDVPVALDAPGLAPGRTRFTSHEEMLAHLDAVKARAPAVIRATLGRSQQGREIPYLVFTREGLSDPAAIRALNRPIVWLIGQQHGNEPAGGEAMLPLAAALADGELKPLLDRVTVVIVPRANPDGAEAFTRTTANGLDANRDHLLLTLPEVRAIHARMAELPPDIVVDAHEYQVAGTWLAKFGGLQKADAMLLYATHPAVPQEVAGLAETAYIPAIEAAFRPLGLTWFWYHTATTASPQDRTVSLGGNAPGISRNNFGLNGAVSFLVETRGIGVGLQGFQRRVATHYVAAKAVLEKAAADPETLRRTVAGARRAIAAAQDPLVVGYRVATVRRSIPLIEPETGADRPTEVDFTDTRRVEVTGTRPRPAGYLVQPEGRAAVEALTIRGIAACPAPARPLEAEAFMIRQRSGPVNRESINPDQAVEVTVEKRSVTPSPGAVFVPMNQPGAAIVSAALEPDAPGSHVGVGLVPVAPSGEAPVYRVPAGGAADPCR
jgi:Zinc carboxypeptidase